MGVPTDEETQSHVDFVQRALVEGEISNIDLLPNPGVQIKMGFKLAVPYSSYFLLPRTGSAHHLSAAALLHCHGNIVSLS
jgi:hypothetical protein